MISQTTISKLPARSHIANNNNIRSTLSSTSGHPKPEIAWFKNGKTVHEDARYDLYEDRGVYYLEICSASGIDAGDYTVTATNALGTVYCTSR